MNKENNKRYQETEERIRNAYGRLSAIKPADRITVTDICREADIHRTTFYGHYQDIIDLQAFVIQWNFERLGSEFARQAEGSLKEGFLVYTRFFCKHRQVIQKGIEHFGKSEDRSMRQNFKQLLSEYYQTSDFEYIYKLEFLTAGISAVLGKWILSNCRETPEEMAELLSRYVEERKYI